VVAVRPVFASPHLLLGGLFARTVGEVVRALAARRNQHQQREKMGASHMMNKHHSGARKAMIIQSPHAGRSALFSCALRALEHAGVEVVDVLPIAMVADAVMLGPQWKANGIDLLVAAGGDGVVGSVTRHALLGQLPLGILPLGTANDLARSLGIPQDPASAAQVIAAGVSRPIDLGWASAIRPKTTFNLPQPRLFAHALSMGLSVQFAQIATNKAIRERYGRLTYPLALWQAFQAYRPIDADIHLQGVALRKDPSSSSLPLATQEQVVLRSRIAQVTAVNAPIFWGGFQGSVPAVSFTDRRLDIVIVEAVSRLQLAQRMLHFFTNRSPREPDKQGWHAQYPDLWPAELTDIPGIHHLQAQSMTIFTQHESQAVTLDGEISLQTPVEARVADTPLQIFVPEEVRESVVNNKAPSTWLVLLRLLMCGC
jgi:diacylglycerol kinase family enzyme